MSNNNFTNGTMIVFTVFDDTIGPLPVLSSLSSSEKSIGNRVAIKSIMSTMSEKINSNAKIEGEAIIPFPDEGLIGFVYYISLDQKNANNKHRIVSITYLTANSASNKLYANAATLSKEAKEIGEFINTNYIYGEKLSTELKNTILNWGKSNEENFQLKIEKSLSLINLFNIFKPITGIRRYEDPLGYALIAFLHENSVIVTGSDQNNLSDTAELFQKMYHLKELRIEKMFSSNSKKLNLIGLQKIPNMDLILLSDDQYENSSFNNEPLVILRLSTKKFKLLNYFIEEKDIKRVNEWLKQMREENTDESILHKIRVELDYVNDKINQLIYLINSDRESSIKEVTKILNTEKNDLGFLVRIILQRKIVTAAQLNKLLNVKKYTDLIYPSDQSIGKINL